MTQEARKMKMWNRLNEKLHESSNPQVWIKEFYSIVDELTEQVRSEERKRIKKHIYNMIKEKTHQRNETISEVLYSIENDYVERTYATNTRINKNV